MPGRITDKWRPSLALILGATLLSVLCFPVAGIVAIRVLSPLIGFREAGIVVAVAILVLTAALGWVLWRILLRPIRALAERAENATRGGSLDPLRHYGTREMRAMGQAIIDMGRVLQGREAVVRSYADHATHELKTPLTVVRGAVELLDNPDLTDADRTRLLARIDGAAERMTALLDAQRLLARAQEPLERGSTRLSALLPELEAAHPALEIGLAGDTVLPMGADGMRMVLDHLLGNARRHGATKVSLQAQAEWLSVSDNGPGISAGNRDRIFDPFFTTRREDGGTGMGLAIVKRMLEAHGGEIALGSNAPGAVFEITF